MDLSNLYSLCKSLHLIGMVSWMAGMFYLVRIYVNHAESNTLDGPEKDTLHRQFVKMEGKAYRVIMTPAMVFTWVCGTIMLCIQPAWLQSPWMHVKLTLLTLLTGYHHYCKTEMRRLESGTSTLTHVHFRALNEVPTLFLIAIVFLAVFKDRINFIYLAIGLGVMGFMIVSAIKKVVSKK